MMLQRPNLAWWPLHVRCRVLSMPVPPAFPLAAPHRLPPVDAELFSLHPGQDVDWFFTAEQEASSDQLKFKARLNAFLSLIKH
jgi:hypothetical protein